MKAHMDDVTGFSLMGDESSIVTISKDKSMKFWYPPTSWYKDKSADNATSKYGAIEEKTGKKDKKSPPPPMDPQEAKKKI